ncbi:acyltransferase domain-containing protein [Clostridium sp. DJ247]|uniref:acyltransferase domain-containing protein n=1 Tax=Clostridium sp. DJ247 TaxID=2726188 RepID=UPI0016262A3F|nr:acyltransferase domain-containing protein [Clostridium sp. DJ247]MBC2580400.1 acyltransferase domain-containing protein [Clostridium sp. DJ247]
MGKELVFMFSGQGSQYNKMGLELYENSESFRNWMNKMDKFFYNLTGKYSIDRLYYSDSKEYRFDDIFYTHPTIFMVQYALAQTMIENGIYPKYLLGVSLGEYVSMAVSGVLNVESVLELIVIQVDLLKETCEDGAMISILDNVKLYHENSELNTKAEVIATNYDGHFVIACNDDAVEDIQKFLKEKHIIGLKLPVRYAFHSSGIDNLHSPYAKYLKNIKYNKPNINIISSTRGTLVQAIDDNFLWDVLRKPMNFRGAIKTLQSIGEHIYIDLGTSGTLENLAKHIMGKKYNNNILSVITPFGSEVKKFKQVSEYCIENIL